MDFIRLINFRSDVTQTTCLGAVGAHPITIELTFTLHCPPVAVDVLVEDVSTF